jgi:hypothetical protein
MARIPEAEIERLKEEVSVQRLVEAAGVELKKAGKEWLGRCPFHEDAEASLVVTPSKNLWHCFGCQVGGGPIDWVMKSRGVSFRHAVELLKADPALAAGQTGAVKRATVRALPAPVAFDADHKDHKWGQTPINLLESELRYPPPRVPMARLPRYVIPGQPQHIIQRGNNRQAIFGAEGDYQFFRDCLVEAAGRFGLAIHAYVWMTNGWYSGSDTNIRAS